jgi:hypothetical protein
MVFFEGYTNGIKRVIFFFALVPSVNPSVIIFFYYQQIYRQIKNYRWKIYWRSISVGDFVGKLFTDGICVLRWRKNFIGKTVKCYSARSREFFIFFKILWCFVHSWSKTFTRFFFFFVKLQLITFFKKK